jgi:hypothetical protein
MVPLPIPAPKERLKMKSISQLASWVNSNQKLLSKATKYGKQCNKSQGGCIATNPQFPISQTLF